MRYAIFYEFHAKNGVTTNHTSLHALSTFKTQFTRGAFASLSPGLSPFVTPTPD